MDYIEVFENLKPIKKYARKSPQKAVLLLAIIELYDSELLEDNMIEYNDTLASTYLRLWNQLLPNNAMLLPEMNQTFWAMNNEDFWHIVPQRGKEDVIDNMQELHTVPSDATIKDCVRYVELDEDLYFMMTLPSGRKSLKETLLSNYFDLSERKLQSLSKVNDNKTVEETDFNLLHSSLYEAFNTNGEKTSASFVEFQPQEIDDDVWLSICIVYYKYVKKNGLSRNQFCDLLPSPTSVYKFISSNDVASLNLLPSLENHVLDFMHELKIALMSDNNSMSVISMIDETVSSLESSGEITCDGDDDNEKEVVAQDVIEDFDVVTSYVDTTNDFITQRNNEGKEWTDYDDERLSFAYEKGYSIEEIAGLLGRTIDFIKTRMRKLNLIPQVQEEESSPTSQSVIDTDVSQSSGDDFFVENSSARCAIFDRESNKIYSSTGKLKVFQGVPYRISYVYSRFRVNMLERDAYGKFNTSTRIIDALSYSPLHKSLDQYSYLESVWNIVFDESLFEWLINIKGVWYDSNGEITDAPQIEQEKTEDIENVADEYAEQEEEPVIEDFDYTPKGKLKKIEERVEASYDYLWVMSVIDLVQSTNRVQNHSFDTIACMMIANAWELLKKSKKAREGEERITECIEFLIDESKKEMDVPLSWNSSKEEVFAAIKDFPMYGVFEDAVDALIEESPFSVLKTWYFDVSEHDMIMESVNFTRPCLYALHLRKNDSFIEVNRNWLNNLYYEHDNLIKYFTMRYYEFIERLGM